MKTLTTTLKRNANRVLLAALLFSTILFTPRAQTASGLPQSSGDRVALYQALLDLTNPWTVMCVAAHPDDEDGTSLIVMRRKYGAHTVSLFSTFGEGGQNAIGPELYEELGAMRARETMAASEIQGSEPHFLGLKDFGFSKSADETFQKWGHEEALRRMVQEIRKLRPDVIITNHSVTSNDHGHHQATARLVVEAFDAAADPKRFPEQLKDGVTTWQVQRLFVRVRGQNAAGTEPIVTIDPNEQDPIRGTSFAEQALSALQKHATQGPWPKSVAQMAARFANQSDGRLPIIRYRLAREAKGAGAPPQDAKNFLAGLELPAAAAQELALPDFSSPMDELNNPSRVREGIIKTYRQAQYDEPGKADPNRREMMRAKMQRAAALAAGLRIEPQLPSATVIANSSLSLPIRITYAGAEPIALDCGAPETADNSTGSPAQWKLTPGQTFSVTKNIRIPNTAKINVPLAEHLYDKDGLGLSLDLRCTYEIDHTKLALDLPLRVDVAPPIEIADISPSPVVLRKSRVAVSSAGADILPATPPKISVKLINHTKRPFKGEVAFGFENRSPETRVRVDLLPEQTTSLAVAVPNPEENRAAHLRRPELANSLWFALRNAGMHENQIKRSVPVVWLDANVSQKLSVGYVRGFDFSLPNALTALGVASKELSVADVNNADLGKFTSIILDNRVYESQPELISANQKLLDYANAGGTLIVFYHKTNEWNPDPKRNRPQLAPYKLIVNDDRVTDENAPITFLEPNHPLLNSPNKIGPDDFVGWIQERGVYYPKEWDPQFHALLQSNDPGEAPLKGGLLAADYGKGKYIYTSMVWYRQLRAGIPGAYRMLANMISYGR